MKEFPLIHRKLKPTGTMFLHCDWHASHRLRCMMDDVFGEENFRNEIIWKRTYTTGSSKSISNKFSANTDTILFYQKSKNSFFRQIIKDYAQGTVKRYDKVDEQGRRFKWENLKSYSKERLDSLIKAGEAKFNKGSKYPVYKTYFNADKGTPIENLWDDIEYIGTKSPERLGYPTQKPEALIRRILECSSNEGDVILDCFGGGGTTAKVAADLGRTFITGDVSPVACRVIAERLVSNCPKTKFEVKNLPTTEDEFRSIDGHEFAKLFCDIVGWEVNPRKSGDKGIDGWDARGVPIQIKNQKNKTSRESVQKFLGALMAEKAKEGKFVSWEFSRDAIEFIAEIKKLHKIVIEPVKCADRLSSLILSPDKQLELQVLYDQKMKTTGDIVDFGPKKKKKKTEYKEAA